MFLQAYADDSASEVGDKRLFFAGYLNAADRWALFSEAWDEELKASPSIRYLKMAEAQNLRDEFKGWSEAARDEKLKSLARVIRHFKPISFEFSVGRKVFFDELKPVSPRGLQSPHFGTTFHVISGVSQFAAANGGNIPIDFIFDEQDGVSEDILLFFDHMKKNIPLKARKLIGGPPIFRDDKEFLPLQAADMIAWHLRREHETCQPGTRLPMASLLRNSEVHLVSEIPDEIIRKQAAMFATMMPGISLVQSKGQWRKYKRTLIEHLALGYIPPHGTRWKNLVESARERLARLFRL